MSHQIRIYDKPLGGGDFPPSIIPFFGSGIGIFVSFIAALPPTSAFAFPVMAIFAAMFFINLFLYKTHCLRGIDPAGYHLKALNAYRSLSDSDKLSIPFDVKTVAKLSNVDSKKMHGKLEEIQRVTNSLEAERSKYNGPLFVINERIDEIITDRKQELQAVREVNQEMQELRP